MGKQKMKATLQGGWDIVFEGGHYCGKARDSLNVAINAYIPKREKPGSHMWYDAGVLTRNDLKRLRNLIDDVLSKRARKLWSKTKKQTI